MTSTVWDQQATTIDEAWQAVWAEDDQQAGIDHCLRMLAPLTDHIAAVADAHVLDVGAGIGRLAIPIAQSHPTATVWGLDSSQAMTGHLADRCIDEETDNVLIV